MLRITICVGSSCSVRGSDELAESLERLLEREGLLDRVELVGAFCMEKCSTGVSLKVEDTPYSQIRPEDVSEFFNKEILPRVMDGGAG